MHQKSFDSIIRPLVVLAVCLSLWGCGGAGSTEQAPQEDAKAEDAPAAADQTQTAPSASYEDAHVHVMVSEGAGGALSAIAGLDGPEFGVRGGVSTDEVVDAIKAGAVDIYVVPLDTAAVIYNVHECPSMAIDALEGNPPVVSVVTLDFFRKDPEAAISYIDNHAAVAEGGFYRGSEMQDYLTAALSDLYVADPDSVGGYLLPDNFYFLR